MRTFIVAIAALLIATVANAQTAKKEFIGPVQADASSTAVKVPANQHSSSSPAIPRASPKARPITAPSTSR
jgi:hypothetical protein